MPLTKESLGETFHIDDEGVDRVIEKIKALIHEGNVRRVIVKDRDGVTLIEAPLTLGVVGAVLAPVVSPSPSSLSARSRMRRSAFFRPTRGTP